MAIIVDKEQKKRDIALACKNLVVQKRLNALTVAELAKAAGVGKGTIYEYFQNKEEIVFEIVLVLMEHNREMLRQELALQHTTKEKIIKFAEFFYNQRDYELREIYKEFISITLINPTPEMLEFQTQSISYYYDWFVEIIDEGIAKKELIPQAKELCRGLFAVAQGLFIIDTTTRTHKSLEEEFVMFTDAIFHLLEVK